MAVLSGYVPSAAGVAVVLTAAVHGLTAAVAAPGIGAVMYPDDHDGDDHDDPEGLVVLEKAVAHGMIAVVTHKSRYLPKRFVIPYYASGDADVTPAEKMSRFVFPPAGMYVILYATIAVMVRK